MPDTKRTATGVFGGLAGLVGLSAAAGVLIAATVTPAVAITSTAAERAITMFDNLPSSLEIDKLMLPSNFYYTDPATGQAQLMTQFLEQDRTPVDFDQINPVMYDALLSSEDPRYYQHGGIDLIGTTRALLSNAGGASETQGGSSISQQYVKNVLIQKCEQNAEIEYETNEAGEAVIDEATGQPKVKTSREQALLNCWTDATTAEGAEGYTRKLQEMRYAISLEQKYSKNDILLGYLNIANFGGITYGIEAAARRYFATTAANLTVAQAATLAGMVQNPNSYRIDKAGGSIYGSDGTTFNKAPDGVIDEGANLASLDALVASGDITEEQKFAAADGYTSTKVRQLYVLSRMLDDGKITREQYVEAAVWPITPSIVEPKTGCANAGGAAYFCQYVKYVIQNDPVFGETRDERLETLQRGGLNVYTTLDPRIQTPAEQAMAASAPTAIEMRQGTTVPSTGRFGSTTASIEATTGRVLAIAQSTTFSEDAAFANDWNYSAQVWAGDQTFGNSTGFSAGSTFKLFTLLDWLEKGKSVNETLNGTLRVFKNMTYCGETRGTGAVKPTGNFGGDRGRFGTPMQFTASSLNTGYLAMAEKLDYCDIANVATKLGVIDAYTNKPVDMNTLNSVIGTASVSPLAIAGAYATVANNGIYCQPQVIDRVTDADGNDLPKPERTCNQVLEPRVAATAAYALQGVMNGGTGSQGNPRDGVPLIGKTGTHEELQSWLVESSTKVATATWAGNVQGGGDIFKTYYNGSRLSDIRYAITRNVQGAANDAYGGDRFAAPDSELTKQVLTDLPDVIGKTVDEATKILTDAGFTVEVGAPVDSNQPAGVVAAQNPGAGKVAGGSTVTINPSNGEGIAVPDVSGRTLEDAKRALRSAGFGNASDGACTTDASLGTQTRATATNPAVGSVVNRNTTIAVDYAAGNCGGGGNGGRGGGGNG
ncbi:transglycosylase domain-containing protein [Microbacterium sp. M3]|uniref:Transglycosylase domain-containing protein n=1 Tax=Microbacterium arthrosphaerae TaxID=792652 RepID=A0ABU4GWS8_9MICO|nr:MULTISPECIES: transglycosylase domain-containing protein [Microbacterium]MDW4571532.1 transglycosylase domain-containing protein [Microbacterium arthrosphaerae]MDW7605387.1 transglycosylase domain-containing protein [Microbacterium sp. M3]